MGRNGLTVAFACLPDLQAALGKFCGPRLGLVHTFWPGLIIISTAGGGDRLEPGLELPDKQM